MSEQRVPFSVREENRLGLTDWWADRIDSWFFNHVCGNNAQTDTRHAGLNTTVAPDADHQLWAGAVANDQSLTSSHTFTIDLIDKAVERAKTLSPAIRPIKIGGRDKYVVFLHPYQVTSMRTNTSTGQWLDITKFAYSGVDRDGNPIYNGALGEYNGCILHDSTRVTLGVNSSTAAAVASTRRAVLCGAQAALMAYGKDHDGGEMTWVEEMFDYGNSLGVSAGLIGGLKKTRFNSKDFGTVVMSTYAAQAA